jgi:hypothetical protein
METTTIDDLTLFFDAEEREAARLVGQACAPQKRTCQVLETWQVSYNICRTGRSAL